MNANRQTTTVATWGKDGWRLGNSLDLYSAMTLVACVSDDPTTWDDLVCLWPRYRTAVVPEFVDVLPIEPTEEQSVIKALDAAESWVLIDLSHSRLVTGGAFPKLSRSSAFALAVDEEDEGQDAPLFLELPPWWHLKNGALETDVNADHFAPVRRPTTNRSVLYGEPLIEDFAKRIVATTRSDAWRSSKAAEKIRARNEFTVKVHREWLMTKRSDLDGCTPRQHLHGGREWIDSLAAVQLERYYRDEPIVALPVNFSGYDRAPMGTDEIIIYFDLCRELLHEAWSWCVDAGDSATVDGLARHLSQVRDQWLAESGDLAASPQFIIDCSRRRVPRVAGVPIEGMAEEPAVEHQGDCECPICRMLADGKFGPSVEILEGYHLEHDDEFAFSLAATPEDWEEQHEMNLSMDASIGFDMPADDADDDAPEEPADEFAPVWSGNVSEEPIPGDSEGTLRLAFLLSELLNDINGTPDSQQDRRVLNERFDEFRKSVPETMVDAGTRLADCLESLTKRYPDLVPRIADFQSQIQENIRLRKSIAGG